MIHASSTTEEAEHEIKHWFGSDSLVEYQRTDEPPHQHLVCNVCGRDQEMDLSVLEPLAEDLLQRYGFEADLSHTAIVGICDRCAAKRGRRTREPTEVANAS